MTEFYARRPGSQRWELESTLLFMMTSFLKSRTETGAPSNVGFYDEDVNVYLAGLLSAYVQPEFMEGPGRYISPVDVDVAGMARLADERARYTIYKVNADHLMVTSGIFDPIPGIGPGGLAAPPADRRATRGPTYYQLAASYARTLARRDTGTVEVLGKLSRGFDTYVTVLRHLRSEYFNLIERFGSRTISAIRSDIETEARRTEQQSRVDALLDLYAVWMRTGDDGLRDRMLELAEEIKADQPGFDFQLPDSN